MRIIKRGAVNEMPKARWVGLYGKRTDVPSPAIEGLQEQWYFM